MIYILYQRQPKSWEKQEVCVQYTQYTNTHTFITQTLGYDLISLWYKTFMVANEALPSKLGPYKWMFQCYYLLYLYLVLYLILLSGVGESTVGYSGSACALQTHSYFHFSQIVHKLLPHLNFRVLRIFAFFYFLSFYYL